jgi:two-component system, OmpR family, sensor histidine kinase SenX3
VLAVPVLAVAAGPAIAAVVLVGLAAAVVTAVVVSRSADRRAEARLHEALARLELDRAGDDVDGDLGSMVAVLERAVRDLRVDCGAAAEARARLQEALDTLPQAVLIVDEAGEVIDRNEAAEAFVAARHSDALVEAAVGELVDSALRGEPASRTIDLFGPPRRVVVVMTAPLESSGGRTAVAVVDDITERRRLEAVRTDFVANISHELKTPVGAIGLLAETLQAEDDPEVTERLATRIQNEALRVGRTIEDLLELSRIELGQVSAAEPVAVDDIVLEAVERMRPAAEQAGISVVADAVPDDLVIAGDRRQLTSALSNLLDNAVKYSDPGGSVEVEAVADGDQVVISVADHGIGIPTRDIERVFERFYRVDQARSRQTGGTGLGLAIVRHVVANHHGSVDVESRLGEGSRFILHLPSAPTTVSRHDAPQPAQAATNSSDTTREALRQ